MGMVGSSGAERTQGPVSQRVQRKRRTLAEGSLRQCPATKEQGEAENQEPGCSLRLEKQSEWEVGS